MYWDGFDVVDMGTGSISVVSYLSLWSHESVFKTYVLGIMDRIVDSVLVLFATLDI